MWDGLLYAASLLGSGRVVPPRTPDERHEKPEHREALTLQLLKLYLRAYSRAHDELLPQGETMSRLDYFSLAPQMAGQYRKFNEAVVQSESLKGFKELVTIRASQLNGCAFCLDMHVKEAKIHGERELRVHHIAIWRESQLFSERERAALEWTELLTHLPAHGISEEMFQRVRAHFSEADLAALTFMIVAINGWNRLGVAFQPLPGSADKLYGLDKAGLN